MEGGEKSNSIEQQMAEQIIFKKSNIGSTRT